MEQFLSFIRNYLPKTKLTDSERHLTNLENQGILGLNILSVFDANNPTKSVLVSLKLLKEYFR